MADFDEIKKYIDESEKFLIGFGEAMSGASKDILEKFKKLLCEKDYFILYMDDEYGYINEVFRKERISRAVSEYDSETSEADSDVKNYMKWLSMTMNRSILILELGAGFLNPQALRWPLERITFLNNKARFIRVNGKLPQVAAEISDKSLPVAMKPEEFIDMLCS